MRRVIPLMAVLSLASALVPVPKPEKRPAAPELHGRWDRESAYNGPDGQGFEAGTVVLTVSSHMATYTYNGEATLEWAITSDPLKTPKRLDMVGLKDARGIAVQGIYRIEGDTLTFCYSKTTRPVTFDRTTSGIFTETLKPLKP